MPTIGTVVHVWPMPGPPVRSHDPAIINRYLPADGMEIAWSQWLAEMHAQGHVSLTDPRPKAPTSKPEK